MSKPQLTVEVYASKHEWLIVRSNGKRVTKKSKIGDWHWRVVNNSNGKIQGDSSEGYRRKRDCLKAIATLKAGFAKAEVVEK